MLISFGVLFMSLASESSLWSYEGETGPENWGSLSEDYVLCCEGTNQSPIDINNVLVSDIDDIEFNYSSSVMNILNNGHTVQINYDSGSSIKIADKEYQLLQFHFHAPSEHAINSELAEAEAHFVHAHKTADGKTELVVVGVMIYEGEENLAFSDIIANLPKQTGSELSLEASVNAEDLLPSNRQVYHYTGSLTTPPCSEGVNWNVMVEPISMSREQLDALSGVLHNNNRPLQPLNGREVYFDGR